MNNTHYYLQIMEPMFLRENSKKKKKDVYQLLFSLTTLCGPWVCVNVL